MLDELRVSCWILCESVPEIRPFTKYGEAEGVRMLEIIIIPMRKRNKNPKSTRIIKPNFAMREFDSRNSFPASTTVADENWSIDCCTEFLASEIEFVIVSAALDNPVVIDSGFGKILFTDC